MSTHTHAHARTHVLKHEPILYTRKEAAHRCCRRLSHTHTHARTPSNLCGSHLHTYTHSITTQMVVRPIWNSADPAVLKTNDGREDVGSGGGGRESRSVLASAGHRKEHRWAHAKLLLSVRANTLERKGRRHNTHTHTFTHTHLHRTGGSTTAIRFRCFDGSTPGARRTGPPANYVADGIVRAAALTHTNASVLFYVRATGVWYNKSKCKECR